MGEYLKRSLEINSNSIAAEGQNSFLEKIN